MILHNLNIIDLRIFESVYRNLSMTKAASEMHMTQSGISQHIKHLEEVLGLNLFDRIKQKLIPTVKAEELYLSCSKSLADLEAALKNVKGGKIEYTGMIKVGLPVEFGNHMVLPILAAFGKENPKVQFKIKYGFASQMNEMLLNGSLDFAFVDSFGLDKEITITNVFDETLVLCCHNDYLKKFPETIKTLKDFEKLDYIDYLEGSPILKMWFQHHYQSSQIKINLRATLLDVQGVFKFIQGGLGAGIIPLHLLAKYHQQDLNLHQFKGQGSALLNSIGLAYVTTRTMTPAISECLKLVSKAFKKDPTT